MPRFCDYASNIGGNSSNNVTENFKNFTCKAHFVLRALDKSLDNDLVIIIS